VLAACGASGSATTSGTAATSAAALAEATTTAASSSAVAAAPVAHTPVAGKTNLVAYMRTSEQEAFTKRADQFNQANPSTHADFEALTGDYYTPLKTRIAAGQPPDVYYAHTSNMAYQNFATGGTALQIDDMIAKNKVDLSQWFPQGIAALKLGGKLYGLPCIIGGTVVYYNKDVLAKAGVTTVPSTTTELAAAAVKVNRARATVGRVAADDSPGLADLLAEVLHEEGAILDLVGILNTVHGDADSGHPCLPLHSRRRLGLPPDAATSCRGT